MTKIGQKCLGLAWIGLISGSILYSQPTTSTLSPRAFGSRSWRENGLAPDSLPTTGNSIWDVRLAADGQLYYWSGTEWVAITSSPGEISHGHQADVIDIFDDGNYYTGVTVEAALQENGASLAGITLDVSTLQTSLDSIVSDPRWTDARTPLAHVHPASDITSGTLADPRISASSVTQHETALESVLDLQDLQGAVTDAQVPDTITVNLAAQANLATTATTASVAQTGDSATAFFSTGTVEASRLPDLSTLNGSVTDSQVPDTITKTGTASRCARFDVTGVLTAASGDCVSGDTSGSASPGGANTQVQFNDSGVFAGDSDLVWDKTSNTLTIGAGGTLEFGSDTGILRQTAASGNLIRITDGGSGTGNLRAGNIFASVYFIDLKGSGGDTTDGWNWGVGTSGMSVGSSWQMNWSSTGDGDGTIDTRISRGASAVVKLTDALSLNPRVSPPVTCGSAGSEATMYYDTSHALCICGNGAWINLTLIDGGSCS